FGRGGHGCGSFGFPDRCLQAFYSVGCRRLYEHATGGFLEDQFGFRSQAVTFPQMFWDRDLSFAGELHGGKSFRKKSYRVNSAEGKKRPPVEPAAGVGSFALAREVSAAGSISHAAWF